MNSTRNQQVVYKLGRVGQLTGIFLIFFGWFTGWTGCSSTKISPLPAMPPEPPGYTRVPHPDGLDIGDLVAIFTEKDAPSLESLKDCDADYRSLKERTKSRLELEDGAREFVKLDPVKYHWCFYGKLLQLEEDLKKANYLDERQQFVLVAYTFLTPFSRAFLSEYKDSRYLRTAISRYKKLSEYVFYRKVELSAQATSELVGAMNPYGNYRQPAQTPSNVLEKYGLMKPAQVMLKEDEQGEGIVEEIPNRGPASKTPISPLVSSLPSESPSPAVSASLSTLTSPLLIEPETQVSEPPPLSPEVQRKPKPSPKPTEANIPDSPPENF